MDRPSTALLELAYDVLFHSTLVKLIDSAVHGRLFPGRQDQDDVAGRSMAWKLFLIRPEPPLTASLTPHPVPPLAPLRHARKRYISLLKNKMCAPDGSYEEGFRLPGDSTLKSAAPNKPEDWNLNNPLSLDSSNPWHNYFSVLEVRNTIRQDVERTFPETPYFRSLDVQNEMTQILFLHAGERENVGYRQGMHELLACVYRAVDFDSVDPHVPEIQPEIQELCDRTHVAADAYTLFAAVMQRMETWYEWRPPISDSISSASLPSHVPHFSANGAMVSSASIQPQIDVLANGQLDLKPYVAPIVATCASLRDEKLRAVDPRLWQKLREGGVEAQIYGIRWLRLLFTREFSMAESMIIWDGLFASVVTDPISPLSSPPSQQCFELALWISVAMLIRIRNSLILGDYTAQLTHLLRYPSPSSLGASQACNAPALLLHQAKSLMISPTPGTGASLVIQNRNELGIPVEELDPPSPPPSQRRRASAIAATAPPTVSAVQGKLVNTHERPRLQDMITNRIMDANETLGIQRGFLNTISELRKNLPDLSQTLNRTPSWNGSSISLVDERADGSTTRSPARHISEVRERPPWEPRPRSEVECEIAELHVLLKTLGDAVGWAVDVLLLNEDEVRPNNEGENTLRRKKAEAVECMAYVRDILSRGGKCEIDEERLVSEEEYTRRRRKREEMERVDATMPARDSPEPKPVSLPPRIASPEDTPHSLAKSRTMLSRKESTTPVLSLSRTPFTHPEPSQVVPATARSKPSTTLTPGPKKVTPPWEHTRSTFSGDSPYGSESLPRLPPPSTTAPPRKLADYQSLPLTAGSEPRADPLGVLHR